MLLPNKHTTLSQSIFGLAGIILQFLHEPKKIDDIWLKYQEIDDSNIFPAQHDYGNYILALNYLYTVGILDLNKNGDIYLCD